MGKQSTASQAPTGSSAATNPHNCWPRPAPKSVSGSQSRTARGTETSRSAADMKCEGSPGSTPHRFVALTTNQFPVKNSEFANVLRAWTS